MSYKLNPTTGKLDYYESSAIVYDSDAEAFINAANYSLTTYKNAINNLVISLKEANIWSKITAMYPLLSDGINQSRLYQIKYNLKNPLDTNAAYRLTFAGGYTITGTGILFNGVNGYANTYLAPSALNQNSIHFGVYSLSNTQVTVNDIGSIDNPVTSGAVMLIRDASNNFSSRTNQSASNSVANATSLGLYITNRTGASVVNSWRNSTKIIAQTTTSATPNSFNMYIGARNDAGTATLFSNREYSFVTIGSGLTDDEIGNLATIIQTFQFETGKVIYRYV